MSIYNGDLIIDSAEADYSGLKEVTGDLIVRADANLPVLAEAGGVIVEQNATLEAPVLASHVPVYRHIESDDEYSLCRSADGMYVAGCRGPWSAEEALEYWRNPRADNAERAALFVAAIEKAEGMESAS